MCAALTESADYAKAAHAFFEEAWSDVDSMAVWKQDGDFTIRTKTVENADGSGIFMASGEVAKMDVKPEEFLPYFADWAGNVCEVNCNVLEAAVVGKLGAAPVIRWVTKTPFPLSNRVAFAAVYPELDDAADLRFYMSSDGTEAIAKAQFYDVGEDATFALVNIKMSGWSVKPLDGGSCRVRYAYSADLGGNVPRFVANKKAPGIVDAALPGVEAWIKKRRA